MRVAVIPARGGSKRIPRKNIKEFFGKPMIVWSIDLAKKSGLFDCIIVSTDDLEIAQIAQKEGALVPFIRPSELSGDYVGITEVIAHSCQWACDNGWLLNEVCCILPTAPFIQPPDLINGLNALTSGDWDFSIASTKYSSSIFRSFFTNLDKSVQMFFPEYLNSRSQDLPIAYFDAGQFYWGKLNSWLSKKEILISHSILIEIPSWRVQDIDSQDDWDRAEFLAELIFNQNMKKNNG